MSLASSIRTFFSFPSQDAPNLIPPTPAPSFSQRGAERPAVEPVEPFVGGVADVDASGERARGGGGPSEPGKGILGVSTGPVEGGRISMDSPQDWYYTPSTIIAPTSAEDTWRFYALDEKTLTRMSPTKVLELLMDLSPDCSRACHDFQRLCNPGFEFRALKPGSDTVDKAAQKAVDVFRGTLEGYYGTLDVLFSRLFMSAFLRGALFSELVLDDGGREPIDICVPDPATARFKRIDGGARGPIWQVGQLQSGVWVPMDVPTVKYIPIDPMIYSPYGRSMAASALFATTFLIRMLHDIQRVVSQQGYPRIDIEISLADLEKTMPNPVKKDPQAYDNWVKKAIARIQNIYQGLKPDQCYIHTSSVKINGTVGAVDGKSLGAVDSLLQALERQAMRALKTLPLLMGSADSSSEANANRQWEVQAATIKAIQHFVETVVGNFFTLGLLVQGIQAVVELQFAELRAAEELRDAQTQALKDKNASFEYQQGWISQDESCEQATGKKKADQAKPREVQTTKLDTPPVGNVQPDPGVNREKRPSRFARRAIRISIRKSRDQSRLRKFSRNGSAKLCPSLTE